MGSARPVASSREVLRRRCDGRVRGVVSVLGLVAWRRGIEANRQAHAVQENSAKAEQQTREVHRRLADTYQEQGRALLIDQAPPHPMRALPYLVAAREERERAGDDVDPVLRMLFARAADAAPRAHVVHQGAVNMAAFSPDGTRVATASDDNTARQRRAKADPLRGGIEIHPGGEIQSRTAAGY